VELKQLGIGTIRGITRHPAATALARKPVLKTVSSIIIKLQPP
jgi:hypothetical protein